MTLQPGETFEGPSKTLTDAHFLLFSGVTGDTHPIHYDVEYAKQTRFGKPLAHGLLLASMTALGASSARDRIDGFVFVEQGCTFLKPAVVGDTIKPVFVVEKLWDEASNMQNRASDRLRALELLGKLKDVAAFTKRREVVGNDLSLEAIEKRIAELIALTDA